MIELNEQQKKQYNTYRAAGMTPERALAIATKDSDNKYDPNLEAGVDNIIFGKGGLVNAVGRGIKEATVSGFETVYNDTKEHGAGFALLKSPLSLLAGAGRGVGEVVGGAFETVDDLTGEVVSNTLNPMIESAIQSEFGQKAIGAGMALDEAGKGIPSDILDSLNLLGITAVAKAGTASTIKNAILNRSKAAIEGVGTKVDDIAGPGIANMRKGLSDFMTNPGEVVTRGRLQLSELDPQVETVLKTSNFDDVNRHFQAARNAVADPAKPTPIELVGNKAEEAFDLNKIALNKAGEAKRKILEANGDKTIPAETLSVIKTDSLQQIGQKFGVDTSDLTEIKQLEGRFSQLDSADAKLLTDFFTRLDTLGDAPTLREVDDFVDWSQGQLYKQSKTLSKLEVANDAIIAELKQITGKINGELKAGVGNGYGEINDRIRGLLELQDELSRGLGADARKGSGFVKRLFSPTGGNTREIFAQIKKETGIDLVKEATLARFAMENVGDVRQRSLLQSLDIAVKEAGQVDLMRPGTIYNFFREKADLDGQELANAFLRELRRKQ